jgi:hypothetical protein
MGFDVMRRLLASLEQQRLQFETVSVGWRGESLLHPEIEPMLHHLVHWINKGMFQRLEVHTSGRFLTENLADIAALPVPQRWIVDIDQGDGLGLDLLYRHRGPQTQMIIRQTATIGVTSEMVQRMAVLPIWIGDAPPTGGDWHWVAHHDQDNYFKDSEGLNRLQGIAEELGLSLHHQRAGHCSVPEREMVVSWDAKVTLCKRDRQLLNTIGDANHVELADIWRDVAGLQGQCRSVGRPQRHFCRDCGIFEMPG